MTSPVGGEELIEALKKGEKTVRIRTNRAALASVLSLCLLAAGCQPLEMSARDGIAGAKGYITKALEQYPQCNQANTDTISQCRIIHAAAAAQHLTGSALEIYCAGPEFEAGGACNPPTDKERRGQLAAKLKEAVDQLQSEIAAIRQLRGAK